ncbi:UPF0496 protein At1g20180-like [Coffea arabica]|uniref:UPF0496 protein At1g20180-like n=1 Tax=Coffea arabica TaxID=13443 RepID=A0ABM4W1Q5_COFAR
MIQIVKRWSRPDRLKFLFKKYNSRNGKTQDDRLMNKSNIVDEEYMEAFRTNSYIEICSEVQSQLARKSIDRLSSSPSLPQHLSQGVLEPCPQTPSNVNKGSANDLHQILSGFFKISSEACKTCELILRSIHETRAKYGTMKRVLNQLEQISDDDQQNELYRNLASFALLRNPLATITQAQFQHIHDDLHSALQRFTSKIKRIRRRRKFIRCSKRFARGTLIAASCALTIALPILVLHSAVGIVAAPALVACSLGACMKRIKQTKEWLVPETSLERFEAQLDTAAKGIYLIINDFDTMSRLMTLLHDEVEHSKFLANLCLSRRSNELLKEVIREFQINETGVLDELEELEENVYLCILNINRSRRLLVEQMEVG